MLLLARHGETPYNAERRFQGQADVGLTDVGRLQAQQLAAAAVARRPAIAALYASPLRRARETAEVVGAALGMEPQLDPRFAEADTGRWTDLLFDDVQAAEPDAYAAYHATDPDFGFPGGETLEELMERTVDGLVAVTQARVLPALVVCHRGVVRAALAHTQRTGLRSFSSFDVPNGELLAL